MKRAIKDRITKVQMMTPQLASAVMMSALLLAATSATAVAQEQGWEFTLTPYGWAAGLQGNTTTGTTTSDIDISFNDILENLEFGAMVDARLERGRWAIQSNLVWADLEGEDKEDGVRIKVDVDLWVIEAEGRYRLADNWELLAGMRYYDLDVHIRAEGVGSDGMNEDWVDPIVGTAFSVPLSDRWSFHARGDIGGFGAGSDFAWQLQGLFAYRFSESNSLVFGWRHLDWDYDDGSGDDRFGMDTYLTGPVAGLCLRF